jgi:hypothetical protein
VFSLIWPTIEVLIKPQSPSRRPYHSSLNPTAGSAAPAIASQGGLPVCYARASTFTAVNPVVWSRDLLSRAAYNSAPERPTHSDSQDAALDAEVGGSPCYSQRAARQPRAAHPRCGVPRRG